MKEKPVSFLVPANKGKSQQPPQKATMKTSKHVLQINGADESGATLPIQFGTLASVSSLDSKIPPRIQSAPPTLEENIQHIQKEDTIKEEAEEAKKEEAQKTIQDVINAPMFIPKHAPSQPPVYPMYPEMYHPMPPYAPFYSYSVPQFVQPPRSQPIQAVTPQKEKKILKIVNPVTGEVVVPTKSAPVPVPVETAPKVVQTTVKEEQEKKEAQPQGSVPVVVSEPVIVVSEIPREVEKSIAPEPVVVAAKPPVDVDDKSARKVYTLEFMLSFMDLIVARPSELNDKALQKSGSFSRSQSQVSMAESLKSRQSSVGSTPPYGKGRQGSRSQRDREREREKDRKVSSQPVALEEIYQPSEDRWTRPKNLEGEDKYVHLVQAILNKITWETFDVLSDEILSSGITTEGILLRVLDVIFAKATDEPHFASLYARLCLKMSSLLRLDCEKEAIAQAPNAPPAVSLFRRHLLSKCQDLFENKKVTWSKDDKDVINVTGKLTDEDYLRIKAKRRFLGNLIFVGELFKVQLVAIKTIHRCIRELLPEKDEEPGIEEVESLCKLFATVGEDIDQPLHTVHITSYFQKIAELSQSPKLPSRIKFMLIDLIDLRKRKWKKEEKKIDRDHSSGSLKDRKILSRDSRNSERESSKYKESERRNPSETEWKLARDLKSPRPQASRELSKKSEKESKATTGNKVSSQNAFSALLSENKAAKTESADEHQSDDVCTRKTKDLLNEFFESSNLKEAMDIVKEEIPKSNHTVFVIAALNHGVEMKRKEVMIISGLFAHLYEQQVIERSSFKAGFAAAFEYLEDLVIDIPSAYELAGVFIGHAMASSLLTLDEVLHDVLASILLSERNPILSVAGEAFATFRDLKSETSLKELVLQSKFSLEKLVQGPRKSELINNFIVKYELFFLDPEKFIGKELFKLLESHQVAEAKEWLLQHAKAVKGTSFLIQSVFLIILNLLSQENAKDVHFVKTFSLFSDLLIYLRGEKLALQLTLLRSLQEFYEAKGEKDMYYHIFRRLFHEEIVSSEAYEIWKTEITEATPEASAYLVVAQWLTWLESGSDGDDPTLE